MIKKKESKHRSQKVIIIINNALKIANAQVEEKKKKTMG